MTIKFIWWRIRWVYYMRRGGQIKRWRLASIRHAWRESASGLWEVYFAAGDHPADAIVTEYQPHSHP